MSMSSAEVFSWGTLLAAAPPSSPTKEQAPAAAAVVAPLESVRRYLVRKVYAGFGAAVLRGDKNVDCVPKNLRPDEVEAGHVSHTPTSLAGLHSVAFGQQHALVLLREKAGGEGDERGERGGSDDSSVRKVDDGRGAGAATVVLAYGAGEQGQLGLGGRVLGSKVPRPIQALTHCQIVQVACGSRHSAAVTLHGDLYTWGRGIEGQLGHSSRRLPSALNEAIIGVQFQPKAVPAFLATKKRTRPVQHVACGHNFTVVVTRAGEVWAFGEGAIGQLGLGRVTSRPVPTMVMPACPLAGEPFVEVAAGWAHALARTSRGAVFSWGFNALGSLGLGDNRTRFVPERVPFVGSSSSGDPDKTGKSREIAYGDDHNNNLASTNTANSRVSKTATATTAAEFVVKIHASGNCSGALTSDGQLLTWGCGSGNRLGHNNTDKHTVSSQRQQQQPEDSKVRKIDTPEHVLRPRRVDRLANAKVADFALCGAGGIALVPLRVSSTSPSSGPMTTGCRVTIQGDAFWDSPDIVVKFSPTSQRAGHKPIAARSAVGTYVGASGGSDGREEHITCMAPCFACPGEVCVEVSVDGKSFSTEGTKFHYYETPEATRITPNLCRPPIPRLRIDGHNITPDTNGTMLVRFQELAEDEVERCDEKDGGIGAQESDGSKADGNVHDNERDKGGEGQTRKEEDTGDETASVGDVRETTVTMTPPVDNTRDAGGTDSLQQDQQQREQQGTAQQCVVPPSAQRRVFTVPGRVESELVVVGQEAETEHPIYEERLFISCDAPPLCLQQIQPQQQRRRRRQQQQQQQQQPGVDQNQSHVKDKLPFISRVTVAPNGETFPEAKPGAVPLRFVAHDPRADECQPTAFPIPMDNSVPTSVRISDGTTSRGERNGMPIRITGRNLYRGLPTLVARLRFGPKTVVGVDANNNSEGGSNKAAGNKCVVPLESVTFDRGSASITAMVPFAVASEVVAAGAAGAPARNASSKGVIVSPPARKVIVEISVDGGDEYFAVPERLTLYRELKLTLQGDGLFPAAEGGVAELLPAQSTFRGHDAKVRLLSITHGLDVTVPLLSSRPLLVLPHQEKGDKQEETTATAGGEHIHREMHPPEAGKVVQHGSEIKEASLASKGGFSGRDSGKANPGVSSSAERAAGGIATVLDGWAEDRDEWRRDGEEDISGGNDDWVEQLVPVSAEPFSFVVPPLHTLIPKPRPPVPVDVDGSGLKTQEENTTGDQQHDGARGGGGPEKQQNKAAKAEGLKEWEVGSATTLPTAGGGGPRGDRTKDQSDKQAACVGNGLNEPAESSLSNRTLRVLVSLNGTDNWRPAEGPPLVYFQPPPEPDAEPEPAEDAKKSKAKKK